jgi:uncharacterized protein (TIGR02118 family)
MKKLIALYRTPEDVDAFLAHYRKHHAPLVAKIPGLVKMEITSIERTLMGEPGNFLLAEMYFADADSFRAAMKSPENGATGADLANFADGLVTVMTGATLDL